MRESIFWLRLYEQEGLGNRRCWSYLWNPFLYKQDPSKYDNQGICSQKEIPRRKTSSFFTTTSRKLMQGQLRIRTNPAFQQLQSERAIAILWTRRFSQRECVVGVILSYTRVPANTIKASVHRERSCAGNLAGFSRPHCESWCKVSCGSEPIPLSSSYRVNAHISCLIQFDEHAACRHSQQGMLILPLQSFLIETGSQQIRSRHLAHTIKKHQTSSPFEHITRCKCSFDSFIIFKKS